MQHFEDSTKSEYVPALMGSRPEKVLDRLQDGPLGAVGKELLQWLSAQRYAPTTQINLARAAVRLGAWMITEDLSLDDLDQARVMRMIHDDNARAPKHRSANENFSAILRFLTETDRLKPELVVHAELRPAC